MAISAATEAPFCMYSKNGVNSANRAVATATLLATTTPQVTIGFVKVFSPVYLLGVIVLQTRGGLPPCSGTGSAVYGRGLQGFSKFRPKSLAAVA